MGREWLTALLLLLRGARTCCACRAAHFPACATSSTSTTNVCSTHLPPWVTSHRPAPDGGGIPPAKATETAQPADFDFRASLSAVVLTIHLPSLFTNSHLFGCPTLSYSSRSTCSNRPLTLAALAVAAPLITTCAGAAAHAASTCSRHTARSNVAI